MTDQSTFTFAFLAPPLRTLRLNWIYDRVEVLLQNKRGADCSAPLKPILNYGF